MQIDLSRVPDVQLEHVRRAASGRAGWEWWTRVLDHETARRQGDFPAGPIEVEPPVGSLQGPAAACARLRDSFRDDGRPELQAVFEDLVAELAWLDDLRKSECRRLDAIYRGIDPDDNEWTAEPPAA